MLSRRKTLQSGALGLAAALSGLLAPKASGRPVDTSVPFGAAVRPGLLDSDAEYAGAIARYCDVIVPEGGMLWNDLRPDRSTFDFKEADRVAGFAVKHGLKLHGHTLVWYGVMPEWTQNLDTATLARDELLRHIDTVVGRYKNMMRAWVVVNEPLTENAVRFDDLRPTVWQRTMGIEHLSVAFHAAHAADPDARLVINEFDIEYVGERYRNRRAALTALVRYLVDHRVPLHGVGIQGHLKADRKIDTEGLREFARDMKALGLKISVTELDVIDDLLPADVKMRDTLVAKTAQALLSSLSDIDRLDSLLTWGITDKYTWVPTYYKRADGLKNRPLPLTEQYVPKPLMATIAEFSKVQGL